MRKLLFLIPIIGIFFMWKYEDFLPDRMMNIMFICLLQAGYVRYILYLIFNI